MKLYLKSILAGLALLAVLPSVALADARGHGGHGGPAWRGNIRSFGHHDINIWRGGGWRHTNYGGRLGWWWVVGGSYYLYQQPIYPYPYPDPYQPPVVVVEQQPQVVMAPQAAPVYAPQQVAPQAAAQNWYFCDDSQTYYPYVASCAGGWRTVPATPQGAPQ